MTASESFINEPMKAADIPTATHLTFDRLDERHTRVLLTEWLIVWLIPTVAWTVLYGFGAIKSSLLSGFWPHLLPLALLVPILVLAPLYARHCGFAVRDHDIHFKNGILWRKQVALPFNRIQHVETEQNPFERLHGLATLKFFTAGGGSADMKIPALATHQANDLKALVLEKAGEAADERA